VGFGAPRHLEFHLTQELLRVIAERPLDCERLADTRSGKGVCDSRAVGFGGELLAALGEMGLTRGSVEVG
jgi:hypothetical protein